MTEILILAAITLIVLSVLSGRSKPKGDDAAEAARRAVEAQLNPPEKTDEEDDSRA